MICDGEGLASSRLRRAGAPGSEQNVRVDRDVPDQRLGPAPASRTCESSVTADGLVAAFAPLPSLRPSAPALIMSRFARRSCARLPVNPICGAGTRGCQETDCASRLQAAGRREHAGTAAWPHQVRRPPLHRPEALIADNARVVDYYTGLPLAIEWGGGEVANIDNHEPPPRTLRRRIARPALPAGRQSAGEPVAAVKVELAADFARRELDRMDVGVCVAAADDSQRAPEVAGGDILC